MKIIIALPPNIEKLRKAFPAISKDTIFTYIDLYNPSSVYIDKPLFAHEQTHSFQQEEIGVDVWWNRYVDDVIFRMEQEIEAYRVQYATARSINSDPGKLNAYARKLAEVCSGPLYGNSIRFIDALEAITQ